MKKYNVVIVGGGSHRNPDLMAMLASKKDVFPLKRVVLYDNEAERQEIMGQYGEILMREYYPELEEFIYTTDPDVAFKDVDFALMQIRAGRLPMREKDEKIPLAHGCVGQETCGAGGFAYGLRSVPAIIELVKQIRKHSPEAWILNYSNPAAIVAEATKRIFPDKNYILQTQGKEPSQIEAEILITDFLKTQRRIDGIFASSDLAALGALYALKRANLKVPEQVKLIGFDNTLYSRLPTPSISTIERNPKMLAEKGCEVLLNMIQGKDIGSIDTIVPVVLVERESSK